MNFFKNQLTKNKRRKLSSLGYSIEKCSHLNKNYSSVLTFILNNNELLETRSGKKYKKIFLSKKRKNSLSKVKYRNNIKLSSIKNTNNYSLPSSEKKEVSEFLEEINTNIDNLNNKNKEKEIEFIKNELEFIKKMNFHPKFMITMFFVLFGVLFLLNYKLKKINDKKLVKYFLIVFGTYILICFIFYLVKNKKYKEIAYLDYNKLLLKINNRTNLSKKISNFLDIKDFFISCSNNYGMDYLEYIEKIEPYFKVYCLKNGYEY